MRVRFLLHRKSSLIPCATQTSCAQDRSSLKPRLPYFNCVSSQYRHWHCQPAGRHVASKLRLLLLVLLFHAAKGLIDGNGVLFKGFDGIHVDLKKNDATVFVIARLASIRPQYHAHSFHDYHWTSPGGL